MVSRLISMLSIGALAVAGCAGGPDEPAAPAGTEQAVATFTNPVHRENFPDPGAILADGTWYAYGTNDASRNVPVLTSPDLVTWTPAGDALPEVGKWAERGNTWAPEVDRRRPVATCSTTRPGPRPPTCSASASPGPSHRTGPVRGRRGTAADLPGGRGRLDRRRARTPTPTGALWLHWKNDGNHIGEPTHLYGSRLSADGRSLQR